jgi:hypothetical protein
LRQPGTPQGEAETQVQWALDVARRPPLAAEHAGRSPAALGTGIRLVYQGFDPADLQEAKVLLEELA